MFGPFDTKNRVLVLVFQSPNLMVKPLIGAQRHVSLALSRGSLRDHDAQHAVFFLKGVAFGGLGPKNST